METLSRPKSMLLIAVLFVVASLQSMQAQTGLQFNGSNQYVTFGTATALGTANFTIECWFKRTGTGVATSTGTGGVTNAIPLVTKGRGEAETPANLNMNYFLGIDNGTSRLAADFEEGAGPNHPIIGTTTIVLNTWYHAAVTYDVATATIRLYLNGIQENSVALTAGITPASTSIQHAAIGTGLTSTGVAAGYFAGVIDEARIWNNARTQQEIFDNMNVEITSAMTGLLGRWGLNEGSGSTANNTISGNPNGILTNSPTWVSGNPGFPVPVPAAPGDLVAIAVSNGQVHLTWSDNSSNETNFEIERSTTGVGGSYSLLATVASNSIVFDDLNLTASIEYCYRVRATNAGGPSTYTSSQCVSTPAEGDYALQFPGTNSYVTFGQATTTLGVQSFTLECWFKRMGAGTITTSGTDGILAVPLITKGMAEADASAADMNFFLGINGPTFVAGRSYGPDNVLSADFEEGTGSTTPGLNHPVAGITPIANDVWYHAAVTFDATSKRWQLFLNGNIEKDTVLASGSRFPQFNSTQHAAIGSALQASGSPGVSAGYGPGYFNGAIDEVRIWNLARTQADIRSTINAQISTSQPGLIARWGLNEGTGAFVNGGAGSTVAGSIMGAGSSWLTPGAPFNFSSLPPDAPTALSATPLSAAQIQLQWTDNSNNEAAFEVERSTTGSGGPFLPHATLGADVITYIDLNLSPESEYCYRVRATNGTGASDYTLVECATTLAAPNAAVHFGGTNSYVSLGTAPTLNIPNFTLETWFKREGAGIANTTGTGGTTAVPLIAKGAAESESSTLDINYLLGIKDTINTLCADFEEGSAGASPSLNHPIIGTTPLAIGTWYHAAASYDGTTWKLYLNGNLEAQLTVGQPVASNATSSLAALATSLRSNGTAQGYFDGTMDEVRIWNYARTQTDIQADINQQINGPRTGLLARWGLNEATGSSISSSAGVTLNGAITGANFSWVTGAPFNITANQAPDMPVLVSPANMATGVSLSPILDVTVSDPEAQNLTVTFYGKTVTASPGADFTFVALPDVQFYTAQTTGSNATFKQQTQWVVNNRTNENIAFVSQLGDMTNNGDDDIVQWRRADTSMSILETAIPEVPYGIGIGNHDQISGTTYYNQFFGTARFAGRPYYGGNYGSNNNNYFELFNAGGMDFILVNLEMDASAAAMHWANGILKANSARRAIVINHGLLANTGNPANFSTNGQAIYDSLKGNANLFLMLCGHVDGEGQRQDTYNGHTVYTLLSDYQGRSNGGDGWMRVMRFSPVNNQIQVRTYSSRLNQFETDANSQFTIPYAMSSTSTFAEIGSVSVPSGSHASITWPAISPGTQYEWYAVVSDGGASTTGPTWQFETIAGSSTSLTSSANPSTPGQEVTFTATVTPSDVAGTVQFKIDGTDFGTPVTLINGIAASSATSTLSVGNHPVVAICSGDGSHAGSTSPTLTQTVAPLLPTYTLTVNTVGNGSVVLNPSGGSYTSGTVVTLTATPSAGWSFAGWSGSLTGTTNPTTITVDANKSVTATFTDQGLAGHWRFDETSGTTASDASGHGLNGAVSGATWTTQGKFEGALSFDGSNDQVAVADAAALDLTTGMTLSAWVYPTGTLNTWPTIMMKAQTGALVYALYGNSDANQPSVYIYSGGTEHGTQGGSQLALNTWTHLAGTFDGSTLRLYVNGTQVSSTAYSGQITTSTGALSIGGNSLWSTEFFAGRIDDARIYNRALTQQQIQSLMTSGPSQYTLTVSAIGSGLTSRSPNVAQYDSGQVVTISATPAPGYQFTGWSGSFVGTTNPASITMNGNKSVTATFALQSTSDAISFAAIGDFGNGGTDAANVVSLIKSLNPSLVITTGDNNYTNVGTTAGWDNVVGKFYGQQFVQYPTGSTSAYVPGPSDNAFFPSIGNHDMDLGILNSQPNYFDLPSNERYYTFTRGPVQFFAIDSDTREPDGTSSTSVQGQWLQAQLAASTAQWKIVFFHQPPYTSGTSHGPTAYMQWPFEQWGVDVVLCGHEHHMERIIRDENSDGRNIAYFTTGAGGQSLYSFGTPTAGSEFRYYAAYGTLFVEATTSSMTFRFYSLPSPSTPIDSYTMLKQTSGGSHIEDFNLFAVDQPVGSHTGWYDGSPSSGPVVRASNGVPGSGGQPTQGLDGSATICTWTENPFIWSDALLEAVVVGMDFKSDANGQFDDDRVCWNTSQSTDSRYNFGVQLDNASGTYAITTYWRGSIADDDPRIQDPIVALTGILPDTWYRLRATITKLTATSARIDVSLVQLDANGNPTGTPITGSVPNTSTWSGGSPDPAYFTAGAMWPAFKNHTGANAPADNAYAEYVIGTPVQYTLTTGTAGNGSVTLSPPGGTYNSGTLVTLTAIPETDWTFTGWSGDLGGATNPTTIIVNGDKNVTATFIQVPPGAGWMAFNDCVFDPSSVGAGTDPNGNSVHYRGTNITTFGIGTDYTGPTSGQLIKRTDGAGTGVTVALTQSGGVTWQPDVSTNWYGGYDPNPGTDAFNTFHGIADMTGVIHYGGASGWYVDLTFTGLDTSKQYTFATSSARCNTAYTNRKTIYTLSGANQYTNASTNGVVELAPNRVVFNTGDNRSLGYVARWMNIKSSTGTFTVRATADPTSDDGYKSYSFDVFMLQEIDATPPSDMVWNADITVSDGASSQMLTFGQAASGTDGLDSGLGELPLPPPPPLGVFDARFNLPVAPSVSSLMDYRDSAVTEMEWDLLFQRISSADQVTFTWDTTALRMAGGIFLLQDAIDGSVINVNMKLQPVYVLDIPSISILKVKRIRLFECVAAMDSGWNMISVPLMATDMDASALFPEATSQAYSFDSGYVARSILEPGRGYWLEFPGAETCTVYGRVPQSNDIPVAGEWNMIGPLSVDVATSGVTTTPSGIIASPFYGFSNGYTVATTLNRGKGYWVMTSQAGTLHLGSGTAKVLAGESSIDPSWPRISFTNPQGQKREVYFALVSEPNENHQLPPCPPTGVFDVRFSSNTNVEQAGEGAHEVNVNSTSYPVVLLASNLGGKKLHVQDAINGTLLNEDLIEGKPVVIAQRLNRIVVTEMSSVVDLPKEFALEQNYPNPFNPATNIRFALPTPTRVRVSVFDVLGAKVENLVDAEYEAGYHNIVFEARNYASGMYFYQIVAGQFTSVKKMMVLK